VALTVLFTVLSQRRPMAPAADQSGN